MQFYTFSPRTFFKDRNGQADRDDYTRHIRGDSGSMLDFAAATGTTQIPQLPCA
jgi:hypothetical protein